MSRSRHTERVTSPVTTSLFLLVALSLLPYAPARCQDAPRSEPKRKAESAPAPDVARWQYLLDDLARESRTLKQEEQRPLLLAEVADAYWELDTARARELFASAFESALTLKPEVKEARRTLRRVITLAAGRDAALARRLSEKVLESGAESRWATAESVSAAVDLLETDPAAAAQLAEANAHAGPSMDSAWFIMQLGRRDPAAADRVYAAYLSRFTPVNGFGLERLLWLAGYPFGYAEAFGGAPSPGEMGGFSGMRSPGLTPRPALARAFLDIALRVSQDALGHASNAEPQRAEALNGLVLFTAVYLLPEVRRYRPQSLPEWSQVEQRAQSAATAPLKDAVVRRVKEIFGSRSTTVTADPSEAYADTQAEDLLAGAEKLPGGCRRDAEFAKAALGIGYGKDFSRAAEVSGRVESESIRESVRQLLYYDMASAALKRGDAVSLEDAQKHAELVTSPEQRALLYVKIAGAVLRQRDRQLASGLLGKTVRLAETVAEPSSQASILLAAAAGFADFDAYEGYKALRDAVKVVNRAKGVNVDDFRILRKVNLACRAGEDTWYGAADSAERFSLFETFAAVASTDVDGALSLARELDEPPTRIRSLISVARAATKKSRGVNTPSP